MADFRDEMIVEPEEGTHRFLLVSYYKQGRQVHTKYADRISAEKAVLKRPELHQRFVDQCKVWERCVEGYRAHEAWLRAEEERVFQEAVARIKAAA